MAGSGSRVDQILERAAAYYEAVLWQESPRVCGWLADTGVSEATLRSAQVGYAPADWRGLLEHLDALAPDESELIEAGIARPTERGRLRVQFRSRVMFPVRDRAGLILGFAAQATSPGPSWPEWQTSPESTRYGKEAAIFGIDAAADAIARTGRALVLSDCLGVLRLRQSGEEEAVAVIRSGVTDEHVRQLAAVLGVSPDAVALDRPPRDDLPGVRPTLVRPASHPAERIAARREAHVAAADPPSKPTSTRIKPDRERSRTRLERVLLAIGAVALGVGIPLGWVALTRPPAGSPSGPGTAFVIALGGVAATYVALTLAGAVGAGWVRRRSRARRMRAPWERGNTEWQPLAWTYHSFEEMLIAAALVSVVTCIVLFVTVGGFSG